jgi:hypothetical protein
MSGKSDEVDTLSAISGASTIKYICMLETHSELHRHCFDPPIKVSVYPPLREPGLLANVVYSRTT